MIERVLGYRLYPSPDASAVPKAAKALTGIAGEPDVMLGAFGNPEAIRFDAVLELKALGVDLDQPQSREGRRTPVEQAFGYGSTILGVRWVLVSDMRRIRLYHINSAAAYKQIDLLECVDASGRESESFWSLLALFSHDQLVSGGDQAPVVRIPSRSNERELEVRDSFYAIYYQIRADLFAALAGAAVEKGLPSDRDSILHATQRLLDRMLFLYYCFGGLLGRADDAIMAKIETHSRALGEFCERTRGEEVSKEGLLWVCPSCDLATVPGRILKGGGADRKPCPHCGHVLTSDNVTCAWLLAATSGGGAVPWVDGDDVSSRYGPITPSRHMSTGVRGFEYKDPLLYRTPKILIRQAGVGINAALDLLGVRCPQSMYIYRLREPFVEQGCSHEFLLAALLSRTFIYFVFMRFGEVDPARAHAKMTHERLNTLPVPLVDFSDRRARSTHGEIVDDVRRLLAGESAPGGEDDLKIEQNLRSLWGLAPEDGAYINGEFAHVPAGQVVRALFPNGVPRSGRRGVIPS